jgi:NADP-dependent 3-hydroxy acid dehydrogenase YdfG
MNHLHNKVVIITGASRGIGRALALALAEVGCKLCLVARSEADLQELEQELKVINADVLVFAGTVADEAFAKRVSQAVDEHFGRIDLLVNNAGYGLMKPFDEIEAEDWDALYAVNVKGSFLFSKAVAPYMKEKRSGQIIVVASDVAKRTFPTGALYCSSKYAQHAFADAIRKELRPYGIKVSTVYSGLVDSYFHNEPEGDPGHAWWLKNEDMARTILFMANQPPHVVIDELMIHPLQQDY